MILHRLTLFPADPTDSRNAINSILPFLSRLNATSVNSRNKQNLRRLINDVTWVLQSTNLKFYPADQLLSVCSARGQCMSDSTVKSYTSLIRGFVAR